MNIVVIGILLFLAIMAVDGYNKGLLKAILSMVAGVVIFLAVTFLTPYVSQFLVENTPLKEKLVVVCEKGIEDMLAEGIDQQMEGVSLESLTGEEELAKLKEVLPPALIESVEEKMDFDNVIGETDLSGSGVITPVADKLADLLVNGIAFMATIIVLTLVYLIIWYAFDIVSKLPILEDANKMGGALLGVVKGTLIVWIGFAVLALTSATEFSMSIYGMISESSILLWLYEHNIFLNLIMMFLK